MILGANRLEAQKFPTVSFVSESCERQANGWTSVQGALTMRGVEKRVKANLEITTSDGSFKAQGRFRANQIDFQIFPLSFMVGGSLVQERGRVPASMWWQHLSCCYSTNSFFASAARLSVVAGVSRTAPPTAAASLPEFPAMRQSHPKQPRATCHPCRRPRQAAIRHPRSPYRVAVSAPTNLLWTRLVSRRAAFESTS